MKRGESFSPRFFPLPGVPIHTRLSRGWVGAMQYPHPMLRSLLTCTLVLSFVAAHAQSDPHGTVQGKLTGADGKPIESAWITAIPAEGEVDANNPEELTKEDGTYSLDVPPGRYFIVANYDWPATVSAPVISTYYPGVEEEASAKAIDVKAGSKDKNIDIKVTRVLTPKTFQIQITGEDGKPLPSGDAYLTQVNQAGIAGSDSGFTNANKDGRVKLMGFEGIDYIVWAENGVGAKKTCAQNITLSKAATVPPVITLQITMSQPKCRAQEDAARKAAYAMQPRAN
jgi:hypothetical protein